jgi:hypothetical protein
MGIMSLKDRIRFGKLHRSGKKKMVFNGVTYSVKKSRRR